MDFHILSMFDFIFFFFLLKMHTVVPNFVSEQVSLKDRDSSTNFYVSPFTTRVPILIDPSHILVYEPSGSN